MTVKSSSKKRSKKKKKGERKEIEEGREIERNINKLSRDYKELYIKKTICKNVRKIKDMGMEEDMSNKV